MWKGPWTWRRSWAIAGIFVGVLVLACVLYLAFGDLGRHRQMIENFVSHHTGRAFAIDGPFELKLFPALVLRAENVRLANAAWGSKPQMMRVGHLATEIRFWSLLSGPIDVRKIELSDVEVLLERRRDGEANWMFEPPAAAPGASRDEEPGEEPKRRTQIPIVIEKATFSNLQLVWRAAGKPGMLARVDTLTITPGESGLLNFDGRGKVDQFPISLEGAAGPIDSLLRGRDIRMDLAGRLGRLALAIKGGFGDLDPLDGANLKIEARGEDVGAMLARFGLPVITTGGLDVGLRLEDGDERTRFSLDATAGDLRAKASGSLSGLYLRDSDFTFEAGAADAARLADAFGITGIPAGPLSIAGRARPTRRQLAFDSVETHLAGLTAKLTGTLTRGRRAGLALDFDLAFDDLAAWNERLPASALAARGRLGLDQEKIELLDLQASLGGSQLNGSITLTRREPRRLEAELSSPRIDLDPFFSGTSDAAPELRSADAKPKHKGGKDVHKRLFSDAPLPLRQLSGREARLHLAVEELALANKTFSDVDAAVVVDREHVELHARGRGSLDGSVSAALNLVPAGADQARVDLKFVLENVRAGLDMKDMQPDEVPPLSVDLELATQGGSARQLAANANGFILLTQGAGKTKAAFLNAFGGDMLSQLRTRLNPFRTQDPYTRLECTVIRADIVNGGVTVLPVLVQTQKVTVAARGKLDLHTEELTVDFDTRPRKGIGVSPGMFTNPFIRLEGTLMDPHIAVGARGVTSGAVAAATGGLSVLAAGFIDRIKGEANMCGRTLKQATVANRTD